MLAILDILGTLKMRHASGSLMFFILALPPLASYASTADSHKFQWNGFITQGWSLSDNNRFFGASDRHHGSFIFREIGMNGALELTPAFQLRGQLLSRTASREDSASPKVDYLFANWNWLQRQQQQAGLRLGRIKNPIGFYNDTRDVAFTRPGVILPQSIYLERIRQLELASDGIGAYYRYTPAHGSWLFDGLWGRPQTDTETELSFFGGDIPGNFTDGQSLMLRLVYEHQGGVFKLGTTYIKARAPFESPFLSDPEIDFDMSGLSGQLNLEHWSFTAEYFRLRSDRSSIGLLPSPWNKDNAIAYYLQAEFRFQPRWTLLLRYDDATWTPDDPDGAQFQAATGLPAHTRFAHDWTIGAAYTPTRQWLLRAEWHQVKGTVWLPAKDNPSPFQSKEKWGLLLLQATYRF